MTRLSLLEENIKKAKSGTWKGTEILKARLESIYQQENIHIDTKKKIEIQQKASEISATLRKAWENPDLAGRSKLLGEALEHTEKFKSQYFDLLNELDKKITDFCIKAIESQALFYGGILTFELANKSQTIEGIVNTFLHGLDGLSKAIDKYWDLLDNEQKEIIEVANKKVWKLSSEEENETDRADLVNLTITQASREIAGFTLWRIQELKEEQRLKQKEKKRKNALEKLKERVEFNRTKIEEDQYFEDFKTTVDDFRSLGNKVYAEDDY